MDRLIEHDVEQFQGDVRRDVALRAGEIFVQAIDLVMLDRGQLAFPPVAQIQAVVVPWLVRTAQMGSVATHVFVKQVL